MIFVSLMLLFGVFGAAFADCRGKEYVVIGDKEMRIFRRKASYSQAQRNCKVWGREWGSGESGRLTVVSSSDKQRCLEEMISSPGVYLQSDWYYVSKFAAGFYIGANDMAVEGSWKWLDGSTVPHTGQEGFQNWGKFEPGSISPSMDCASMLIRDIGEDGYRLGSWASMACYERIFYTCERDIAETRIWSYDNNDHGIQPSSWGSRFQFCGGSLQSPIPLRPSPFAKPCDVTGGVQGWFGASQWKFSNDGRHVRIDISPAGSLWSRFHGSSEQHFVSHMIFHVGSQSTQGSEHSLYGRKYAAELQIFHDVGSDGRRHALSFLFLERSSPSNNRWNYVIDQVTSVSKLGSSSTFTAPNGFLTWLVGDSSSRGYSNEAILGSGVRYLGSLPYPPCIQNVQWTVHTRHIELSTAQFFWLRQVKMEADLPMYNNFRPIQYRDSFLCLATT